MATALLVLELLDKVFKIVGNEAYYVVTHQLSLINSRGAHFDE